MHKIIKTKKGFTLLEMILVVAIIVMLAGVVTFNAIDIYRSSEAGASSINNEVDTMKDGIAGSEQKLANLGFKE